MCQVNQPVISISFRVGRNSSLGVAPSVGRGLEPPLAPGPLRPPADNSGNTGLFLFFFTGSVITPLCRKPKSSRCYYGYHLRTESWARRRPLRHCPLSHEKKCFLACPALSSLPGFFIILLMDKHTDFAGGFLESVGRPLMTGVSLKEQSSFRIGGKAEFFFKAGSAEELKAAVTRARLGSVPFYIIGGGYNILFSDEGYRGLIIRNEAQGIVRGPGPGEIEILSGTPLSKVLQFALDNGLAGLEFLAGIPGTLGGALYSNAGAFGSSIGDIFREGVFLDEKGNERMAERNELVFAYRRSALQRKHSIALSAVLKAAAGDPEMIRNGINENLDKRGRKQPPWGTSCAGSYFKNPVLPDGTKVAAGRLLEEAGARDVRVGDAAVFSGHCNFLINLGRARARDILALAAELKERVRAKSGILLEEEVIYLPGSFSMS